jgi:Xaa-Pro aminopeptidase
MRLIGRKKIDSINRRVRKAGADAALFVNLEPYRDANTEYLTGFMGMLDGAVILDDKGVRLITSSLDYDRALDEAEADEIIRPQSGKGLIKTISEQCSGYGKLGIVKSRYNLSMATGIRNSSIIDIGPIVSMERALKEPAELIAIKKCSGICNKAVGFLEETIKPGLRENEVAAELEMFLKSNGSERIPFETIVSSGKRSGLVHPYPSASSKKISGGLGLVDFGAVFNGYVNDVTVPFVIGKVSKKHALVIDTVFSVCSRIMSCIKEGAHTKSLHEIYETGLRDSGFTVKHSLGHGFGLEVHEHPSLSGADYELREGMSIAVEPGAYSDTHGGCRIEDTILVKRKGCEMLTKSKLIRL